MQPAAPPPRPAAPPPPPARRRGTAKIFIGVVVLIGLAFLAGFIPGRIAQDRLQKQLQTTNIDLELSNLHRNLGVAALEAQRNNFSTAATAAGAFFDGCTQLAQRNVFASEPRTQTALSGYAQQRDSVMVQLAQADPTVAARLAELYFTMEGVLARRE